MIESIFVVVVVCCKINMASFLLFFVLLHLARMASWPTTKPRFQLSVQHSHSHICYCCFFLFFFTTTLKETFDFALLRANDNNNNNNTKKR